MHRELTDIITAPYYFAYRHSGKVAAAGYGVGAYGLYALWNGDLKQAAIAGGAYLLSRVVRNDAVEGKVASNKNHIDRINWHA